MHNEPFHVGSNLVLGATGDLGVELSKRLGETVGVSRSSESEEFEGEIVHADITEEIPLDMVSFDRIYHLATLNSTDYPAPVEKSPEITGSYRILTELQGSENPPEIIYVSSGCALDPELFEGDKVSYSEAKKAGEHIFRGLEEAKVVRLGNIYGGSKGVVEHFLEGAEKSGVLEVHGDGSQTKPFVHLEDAADILTEPPEGTVNFYEDSYSIRQIADMVSSFSDVEVTYLERDTEDTFMPSQSFETEYSLTSYMEERLS